MFWDVAVRGEVVQGCDNETRDNRGRDYARAPLFRAGVPRGLDDQTTTVREQHPRSHRKGAV